MRQTIFEISLCEILKMSNYLSRVSAASPRGILFGLRVFWGCVKSLLPPAAAKYSLDRDIFFLILLRKIRKKMSPSKFNLVRSANKNLFTQPPECTQTKYYFLGQ